MIERWLNDILEILQKGITWFFTISLTYFLPIRDFVHLLIILLIVDMFVGWWANNKTKGETFKFSKFWFKTVPRMLLGTVFLMAVYAYDETYKQEDLSTYIWCGRILTGAVLVSIAQNGYIITRWLPLDEIGNVVKEKLPKLKIKK